MKKLAGIAVVALLICTAIFFSLTGSAAYAWPSEYNGQTGLDWSYHNNTGADGKANQAYYSAKGEDMRWLLICLMAGSYDTHSGGDTYDAYARFLMNYYNQNLGTGFTYPQAGIDSEAPAMVDAAVQAYIASLTAAECADSAVKNAIDTYNSLVDAVNELRVQAYADQVILNYELITPLMREEYQKIVSAVEAYRTPSVPLKFQSASLSLQSDLSILFNVKRETLTNGKYSDPYVVFTQNGTSSTVRTYTESDGILHFRFDHVAPYQMGETVSAVLYATAQDGTLAQSSAVEYGVAVYCQRMFARSTTTDAVKTMLVNLLNYGTQAQISTGYDTENPVIDLLTEEQKAFGTTTAPVCRSVTNSAYVRVDSPKASWRSATLMLRECISVQVKLRASDITGYVVRVRNHAGKLLAEIPAASFTDEGSGVYSVRYDGVTAIRLSETLLFTVYSGDTAVSNTLAYSVESYAASKQNGSDSTLAALVNALMNYGRSASAWFSASCSHNYSEWVVTKPATETEAGRKERSCTLCWNKEEEIIPSLSHTHEFGTTWESDETTHWNVCECGEHGNTAAHTFGDWTVTKESSVTEVGQKERSCSVCGRKETAEIPKKQLPDIGVSLRTAGGVDKFLQEYDFRHDPFALLDIKLARNEAEAAQILLRSDLSGFSVRDILVSDLRLAGGTATIPAENIKVYRQHYMYVDVHYTTANGQYPDASYPDALIEQKYDRTHHSGGLAVQKGKTQGYWITVKTSSDTPAGLYTGTVTVTTSKGVLEVPVNVTVWNLTLSDDSHFRTAYALYGLTDYDGQWAQYYDYLTSYRLSPMYPALNEGDYEVATRYPLSDYRDAFSHADNGAVTSMFFNLNWRRSWSKIWVHSCGGYYRCPDRDNPVFPTGHVCATCGKVMTESDSVLEGRSVFYDNFKEIYNAAQEALPGNIYAITHDEPSWQLGSDWADDVKQFNGDVQKELPGIKAMVTFDSKLPTASSTEGQKVRYLPNAWCIKPSNYVNGDVTDLHAHGQELWFYTCNWPIYPTFNTHIDSYQTAARVLSWLEYDLDIDGYFCYSAITDKRATDSTHTSTSIWENPYAHLLGDGSGNTACSDPAGDNYILLQGRQGDGIIDENVPVPTIRLEALRDGMEDYEYLYLYEAKLKKIISSLKVNVDVRDIMQMLYDALYWDVADFTRDGERVLYVRERLAEMIQEDVDFLYTIGRGGNTRTLTVYAAPGSTVTVGGKTVNGTNGKYSTTIFLAEGRINEFAVTVNGKTVTAFAFPKLASDKHELLDADKASDIDAASTGATVYNKDGKLTALLPSSTTTIVLPAGALNEPGVYNPYTYLRANISLDNSSKIAGLTVTVSGKLPNGTTASRSVSASQVSSGANVDLRLTAQQLEILSMGDARIEIKLTVTGIRTATLNSLALTDNRTQLTADRTRAGVNATPSIPTP